MGVRPPGHRSWLARVAVLAAVAVLGFVATLLPVDKRRLRPREYESLQLYDRHGIPLGESLTDALTTLQGLQAQGMRWTVDVLGESVSSEAMATAAADTNGAADSFTGRWCRSVQIVWVAWTVWTHNGLVRDRTATRLSRTRPSTLVGESVDPSSGERGND